MRPRRTVFSNAEIPGRIHALQPFLSEGKLPDGTRRWWAVSGRSISLGHLPARYHNSVQHAAYVVYSYDTPIAWVNEQVTDDDETGGPHPWFVVPDVGYSPTTGQHQAACLEAWADHLRGQGTYRRFPASGRETVRVPANAEVYGQERRLRAGGMDGHLPEETTYGSALAGVSEDGMHWNTRYQTSRGPGWHPPHHP